MVRSRSSPNFNVIDQQIKQWEKRKWIKESELYSLITEIKKEAEKALFPHIEEVANEKLDHLSANNHREWMTDKWKYYLSDLTKLIHTTDISLTNNSSNANNVVLIIDDDDSFVYDVKENLEYGGYHVVVAVSQDKALELFYMMRPAFVAIDLKLYKDRDRRFLIQLTEAAKSSFTPITVMSANGNMKQNRLIAYAIGVTEFIEKPLDLDVFLSYINNKVSEKERIKNSIIVDELTKAYNRKHMEDILNQGLLDFQNHHLNFSLVMFDLDFFKKINDTYGHLAGDIVLKKLTSITQSYLRNGDYLFRYGGEEFILYLQNTSVEAANKVINDIRKTFNETMFTYSGHTFRVTFSAGITTSNQNHTNIEQIIDEADHALYQSKKNGRNGTTIYSDRLVMSERKQLCMIIIDDDRLTRSILKDAFKTNPTREDLAIDIQTFKDEEEFLSANWYNSSVKYFIFLDVVMPGIDGLEVLKKVRESYPTNNIFISMLSSRNSEENIVRALEKGADDYMLKPFYLPELEARVHRIIERMLIKTSG